MSSSLLPRKKKKNEANKKKKQTHVITQTYLRNAHNYNINTTKKMFSDRAIRNCGPSFWNSLGQKSKTMQINQTF